MRTYSAFSLLFLFLSLSIAEGTVPEDTAAYQLQQLLDLLTVHECEELFLALSRPKESIFKNLQRLSVEKNQLGLPSRIRRDIDKETHCHPALIHWLQTHGKEEYYDRLSRTLQQIRRTDIAIEVAKSMNQEKTLNLQHYVEEYHDQVNKTASYLTPSPKQGISQKGKRETPSLFEKKVMSLSWRDLDLVAERKPMLRYRLDILKRLSPLLYGLIIGFTAPLLIGLFVLLIRKVCITVYSIYFPPNSIKVVIS